MNYRNYLIYQLVSLISEMKVEKKDFRKKIAGINRNYILYDLTKILLTFITSNKKFRVGRLWPKNDNKIIEKGYDKYLFAREGH